ncbi:DoxX family membrane protein [Streptomyces qinzhouensis]|uniref:DoxX family membrane protein n=2 Tax=Streptomyces qinzhouensis TaxID=2599401 RepID=A0A5B8JCD2_9ACTN|nr:DoxX family membrane protein [Streptomyces qinzhouensis]
MVKVHSDPAQVIVNHASFRVQLAPSARPRPVRSAAGGARTPDVARRRAPVVWSGRSAPGDTAASGLLQAVRNSAATATVERGAYAPGADGYDGTGSTQVIPRVGVDTEGPDTAPVPVTPLLPPMRQAVGAYDSYPSRPAYDDHRDGGRGGPVDADGDEFDEFDETVTTGRPQRHGNDAVRHAYYPGRRMNLGVVLLPLRVFLGFISIYAGMGKLCDPVYFDGGERGSMVKWLNSLHPWALAEPLRDFALSHPVGAGLTVAFLQVVVGVLTVLGLWQRVAGVVGALLSAALILTVSWKTVPAYDAPDIVYLAAWSPLIIAGAPVYSVDGHLAGEAWRRLGPRSELWELRRRVLRRGAVITAVVIGLTLLIGSVLGGAVRSQTVVNVPRPGQDPTNHLPGSSLPQDRPTGGTASGGPAGGEGRKPSPAASRTAQEKPKEKKSAPPSETVRETGRVGDRPSQTQGTTGRRSAPDRSGPAKAPSGSSGPSSTGGGSSSGGSSGAPAGSGGADSPGSSGGDGSGGDSGVLGGLLG